MFNKLNKLSKIDLKLTKWMADNGIFCLRVSVGIIFLWFGVLKFFPGLSPATDLASETIYVLSFGLIGPGISMPLLALLETLIGLGLVFGLYLRLTLFLLFFQMAGTVMPLFLFPAETFTFYPFAPTMVGQYIIKNLIIISAGFVIGATVRGGRLKADPQ